MGILLKILSVLGIILLSVIGLVLLLLLIILLAPINYNARVMAHNGDIKANVKIGWMFFIRFLLDFKDKNLDYRLKLFGIRVFPKKENHENVMSEKPAKDASDCGSVTNTPTETGKNETVKSKADEVKSEVEEINIGTEEIKTEIKAEVKENSAETGTTGDNIKSCTTKEETSDEESVKESVWVKLDKLIAKLKASWDICMSEKLEIETFFKRKSTKYTLEVLKKAIFNILNHIRPRKLNGSVEFGFDDPATTGYALAALGAFYGLYCDNLEVTPDFLGKTLEADVTVSGRIVLGYLVFIVLSVYIRKKVRMFIRNVMALKDVSLENIEKIKEQFAKASAEA